MTLGLNDPAGAGPGPGLGRNITVGTGSGLADAYGTISGTFLTSDASLTLALDALENKGVVRTLAEPTLVAMSGDTANFLAGGEFPIPVAQSGAGTGSSGTITVEFKQFGIALAFTPTVLKDGLINLVVAPEVSSIDRANTVTSNGIVIPGLKVRRARTTVELRDGESFTIAGLLADDYGNNINQFPFLGDLPILGPFFRNSSNTRSERELVLVVTPHLVVPHRGRIATPADRFVPPSDFELFLLGSQSGSPYNLRPEDRVLLNTDPKLGGVEGPYGHVLY
jgi:pilus assembly protein CpaC